MTVRSNLTEADYRAFRRHVLFRYRKIHWLYGSLLALLLLTTWLGGKPEETVTEKAYVLMGVVMMFGIICAIVFMLFWVIRRFTGTRFRGPEGEHVFEFSDAGLTEANAIGKIETRLVGIRRVDETAMHFFVITTTGMGHVIPKRDLENPDELRALKSRVSKARG